MFRSLFKRKTLIDYINENDIENVKKCKDQMTDSIYIDAIMNKNTKQWKCCSTIPNPIANRIPT